MKRLNSLIDGDGVDRLQRAYDVLTRETGPLKDKVRTMLEVGEITPSMIDFEYYNEDEIEVSYVTKFADGFEDTTETIYDIEISVVIRSK